MWIIYSRSKSNSKLFSRAISFFSKQEEDKLENVPSHMALVFGQRFMVEARGADGVHLNFFSTFLKDNEIIEIYDYKRGNEVGLQDRKLIIEACLKYHGKKYDFIGVLWFAFYIIRKWAFGTPLPEENKWDGENRFFCSELMSFIDSRDHETSDPNGQMKKISGNQDDYQLVYSKIRGGDWDEFWAPYGENLKKLASRV